MHAKQFIHIVECINTNQPFNKVYIFFKLKVYVIPGHVWNKAVFDIVAGKLVSFAKWYAKQPSPIKEHPHIELYVLEISAAIWTEAMLKCCNDTWSLIKQKQEKKSNETNLIYYRIHTRYLSACSHIQLLLLANSAVPKTEKNSFNLKFHNNW